MLTLGVITCMVLSGVQSLFAQERKLQPEWWFGGAGGINFNYYSSDISKPNASVTTASPFTKGSGVRAFLSPLLEYDPDPVWGGMVQFGFDSRGGSFNDLSSGGTSYSLSTSLNYLSLEPSLKISPFASRSGESFTGLYFYLGPRIGFNIGKTFTYKPQNASQVEGEWSGIRGAVITGQIGAGYDIPLTSSDADVQYKLSPFLAVHLGQGPRSDENWSLTTLRMGIALKFGSSSEVRKKVEREIQFSVQAPKIIPIARTVNETFPMRNYIFFDEGSMNIPARYIRLTREEAQGFNETKLLQPEPRDLTGRSKRQMKVYHNILNILGDRMRAHSASSVTLTGSSARGGTAGKEMAGAVKQYLMDVFGIDGRRISVEGREKPVIPSEQPGGTHELELVRPEDQRVEISSNDISLFDPVKIISLQDDPLQGDVLFSANGAEDLLASWSVELSDETGATKRYGPFVSGESRISGRTILGDQTRGTFHVVLLGETKGGQTIRKETEMRLVRAEQPEAEPGLRFSILFEFDQSKTVATYERFLAGTVAPLIPEGGSVTIHGHTDIVGEESHNLKLSRDRAQETMNIFERELAKAGKKHVKFDTYGFGEDVYRAPFDNQLPEERFYNRTVIIDIVPE